MTPSDPPSQLDEIRRILLGPQEARTAERFDALDERLEAALAAIAAREDALRSQVRELRDQLAAKDMEQERLRGELADLLGQLARKLRGEGAP